MCKPKTPRLPKAAPERAMERLPNRGALTTDARRQVEATYGARNMPATILGGGNVRTTTVPGIARSSSSANTSQMSTVLGG